MYLISEFLPWRQGRLYIPSTGRQNRFFVAHDKRYEVFLSSGENTDSANPKHKELVCLWNKHDFLVGQIKRMTTIPTRGKNTHPLFDWKILKTDHIRLVVNSLVVARTVKILQKKKIDNHVADSCQRSQFHFQTGWLLFSCFVMK